MINTKIIIFRRNNIENQNKMHTIYFIFFRVIPEDKKLKHHRLKCLKTIKKKYENYIYIRKN
jgi:hypothetical protein